MRQVLLERGVVQQTKRWNTLRYMGRIPLLPIQRNGINTFLYAATSAKGRYFFMQCFKQFSDSANNLKKTRTLVITAMFVALNITLDLLNLRIQLTPDLRIGVGFVTSAMVGMLFGPVPAMTAGAAGDMIGWLVNPGGGGYFPGFTITAILAGMIWGLFLYQKKPSFLRLLTARLTISILLNIGLNSLWKMIYFGKAYTVASLLLSVWKNLLLLLPEALLLFVCAKLVTRLAQQMSIHR